MGPSYNRPGAAGLHGAAGLGWPGGSRAAGAQGTTVTAAAARAAAGWPVQDPGPIAARQDQTDREAFR